MNRPVNIIAVGGGGFTHNQDAILEDYLLSLCESPSPRIGFIATASDQCPIKIQRFYNRFNSPAIQTSHLEQLNKNTDTEHWVLSQDIIYVGGGNTSNMLSLWQQHKLSSTLRLAAHNGVTLCGVSAGAVCWFECALSDSAGNGMQRLDAMGLLKGSCCPHYSTEAQRQPVFQQLIGSGEMPAGIAIDDGVAVHFRDGMIAKVVSARPGANAYQIKPEIESGGAETKVL